MSVGRKFKRLVRGCVASAVLVSSSSQILYADFISWDENSAKYGFDEETGTLWAAGCEEIFCENINDYIKDCDKVRRLVIGDEVRRIGEAAFLGLSKLEYVSILGNVEEIAENAFSNCCSLEYFYVPKSVRKIGAYAFLGCKKLTTFEFHIKTKIEPTALVGCSNLKVIKINSVDEKVVNLADETSNKIKSILNGKSKKVEFTKNSVIVTK